MASDFDMNNITGLTESQAAQRLLEDGFNELPSTRHKRLVAIALEVMREPMFILLVACGVIYLIIGREHIGDALLLLGFVFVVMGITIAQQRRTERALEALRDLSSPRALVIRDGQKKRIAGRNVARGDIVILAEGDRIPADAVLRHTTNLSVNESLLTGESVPVHKVASLSRSDITRPGGEDLPFVYSGTLVTSGQGIAQVLATGLHTEFGKIGKSLQAVKQEQTLLQHETARLVRNLAAVGLTLSILVIIIYARTRVNTPQPWKQGLLVAITTAMSILPEELPVILTVFLALGAWRISRNNVLTRRMPAIETLGATTVLCVDKTGTLTLNQMSVRQLAADGEIFDVAAPAQTHLPEKFHELLEFGILASKRDPFDPMEKALRQLGQDHLAHTEHWHENWTLEYEYPLSPEQLTLSHVWRLPHENTLVIAAKGAPEAIADLCHLDPAGTKQIIDRVTNMADQGLRVLGVAKGVVRQPTLPKNQHDLQFTFLGLVGMADPIRPNVPATIRQCYDAGMRVVMITGDYRGTAQNIARQIGLNLPAHVITGSELDQMTDDQLSQRITNTNIFARVVPEQKLRIVNALKANHEITAMTGDGVNDAPALKSAHIGVAMGGRGTDVAREASALVLLDDDFSSIVQAVKLGRRIFDNIKKAVSYTIAVHVPIAGLCVIPVIMGDWPIILMPIHVAFLELIIDPACSVIFEAENAEPNVMNRPPRNPKEGLFTKRSLAVSFIQGFSVLAIVLGVFIVSNRLGRSDSLAIDNSRALTFVTLVVSNLCLILTNRSWSRTIISMLKEPNGALWWVVAGAIVCMATVLTVPFLRTLFHFAGLHMTDVLICIIAGVASVIWFEMLKILMARRQHAPI